MRTPLDGWRQQRAKRRYMPHVERPRTGRTTKVAALALVVILAVAALLELRRGTGAEATLVELARTEGQAPLELVEAAARSRRLLFLSDIPTAAAPKQFASQVIERIASSPGLDLVVLNVDPAEQPYIDRYLATAPEDASILLGRPRAIREGDGASRAFLEIYRTVWRVNQDLGAARRIRIVAADAPGWPPARATSPAATAQLFGQRADRMLEVVLERSLARDPGARVLFFIDGLHVLRSGGGRVQTGGATPVETRWLAAQMLERFPADVFSVLVDATPSRSVSAAVAAYRGTEFREIFRRGGIRGGTALPLSAAFNDLSRSPVRTVGTTGLDFTLEPRDTPVTELADAYIYFGG
ncbi:MAG TPA: hypothetical protein VFZ24_06590 [Longimicrobiales bacterium]